MPLNEPINERSRVESRERKGTTHSQRQMCTRKTNSFVFSCFVFPFLLLCVDAAIFSSLRRLFSALHFLIQRRSKSGDNLFCCVFFGSLVQWCTVRVFRLLLPCCCYFALSFNNCTCKCIDYYIRNREIFRVQLHNYCLHWTAMR